MTGKGERILSEGDKFQGNFLNGKMEGIIYYTSAKTGKTRKGQWKAGKHIAWM